MIKNSRGGIENNYYNSIIIEERGEFIFGNRADDLRIPGVSTIRKLLPFLMRERNESRNIFLN